MFPSFKRKNYIFWEKVKAAVLVEIALGCWLRLLGTAQHGPLCPKCIICCFVCFVFFKDIEVTSDLKYQKDITSTFKKLRFF